MRGKNRWRKSFCCFKKEEIVDSHETENISKAYKTNTEYEEEATGKFYYIAFFTQSDPISVKSSSNWWKI